MRRHFQAQSDLQIITIGKIQLPIERRDKLPTVLAGMDLWHILGLSGGPMRLDADWDRLEHIANLRPARAADVGRARYAVGARTPKQHLFIY
jgi:hypothetical protein